MHDDHAEHVKEYTARRIGGTRKRSWLGSLEGWSAHSGLEALTAAAMEKTGVR